MKKRISPITPPTASFVEKLGEQPKPETPTIRSDLSKITVGQLYDITNNFVNAFLRPEERDLPLRERGQIMAKHAVPFIRTMENETLDHLMGTLAVGLQIQDFAARKNSPIADLMDADQLATLKNAWTIIDEATVIGNNASKKIAENIQQGIYAAFAPSAQKQAAHGAERYINTDGKGRAK